MQTRHTDRQNVGRSLRNIAFWGNFGTGNLGNECTLAAALHNVHRFTDVASLLCVATEPADAGPRHGIDAVRIAVEAQRGQHLPRQIRRLWRLAAELGDFVRVLALAKPLDALLVAGTGILSDVGEGSLGFPYELLKWSLATKIWGGKVYFLSVGVEDIERRWSRAIVKATLRMADYRSFRDLQSKRRLEKVWAAVATDPVYPDLAFSLPESLVAAGGGVRGSRCRVGVGLYSYCGRGANGGEALAKYEVYLSVMCAFITWLLDRDYEVRILIGDLAYDDDVRGDVRTRLRDQGKSLDAGRYIDEPAGSFEELLQQITSIDLVVATRFHSVLLALLLGKPAVSISYDAKNEALMSAMGLSEYCQSLHQLSSERLIDQFTQIEGEAERLGPMLRRKAEEFRALLDEQYGTICAGSPPSRGTVPPTAPTP